MKYLLVLFDPFRCVEYSEVYDALNTAKYVTGNFTCCEYFIFDTLSGQLVDRGRTPSG